MYEHSFPRFDRRVLVIHQGECLATGEDIIISTVLGSCVSVALRDERLRIGGLNHFMLPGEVRRDSTADYDHARYGMYAMELLINELLKLGARKDQLRAKVFGAGSVLSTLSGGLRNVAADNEEFVFRYLHTEGIPVLSSDTGGREARKILFFPVSGKVLLKRVSGAMGAVVVKEEKAYLNRIAEREARSGDVTFF